MKNKVLNCICKTLLVFICVITCSFCLTGCNFTNSDNTDGNDKILSRSATNNDIYFNLSEEFSFSINYKIKPKVDITNLQITFTYYDKNNKPLTTKINTVGNVKKNIEYTVTVSLSEFSFLDIFKINSVSAKVTGGTVSYI